MWYSQSKVEKWGRRGLAPPLPPWRGAEAAAYNHSKLAEEKHKFLSRGGRDKATCMGEPRGGTWAPLLLPREFPLWPQMETWPAAEAQLGSPVFPHPGFWFSVLQGRGVLRREAGRWCASPAVGHLRGEAAGGQLASLPGPQAPALQLPLGTPQSSQRPMLCFWKPGPVRFTPSSQDYPFPAPSQSMAVFCDLVVYAQL